MKYKTPLSFVVVAAFVARLVFLSRWHGAEAPVQAVPVPVANEERVSIAPSSVSVAHDSYLSSVSGSYPQFSQADSTFNGKIADAVAKDVAGFSADADADYRARLETGGDGFRKDFAKGGYYGLSVTSEVVQSNSHFISLIIREEGFTGGAHGFHRLTTYNYDVQNRREITLSHFYPNDPDYLRKVSESARAGLAEKLAKDGGEASLDAAARSVMDEGTDPADPENFKNFTFYTEAVDEVTVYFPEYQVAPYVYGEQTIRLER